MKKAFWDNFPQTVAALFITLFVYTAVSKLLSYHSFYATMDMMPAFKGKAFVVAPLIIVTEILISCLLIVPAFRVPGLYFSLALMSAFTFYLLYAVMSGYSMPCSCGGVLRQLSWKQHIFFNIVFILLAMSGILSYLTQKYLLQ